MPQAERGSEIFNNFSKGSKTILEGSLHEADMLHHKSIGPEHLMLAITNPKKDNPAKQLLLDLGTNVEELRSDIIITIEMQRREQEGLMPGAKKALELAVEEFEEDKALEVEEMHVLLGIVREGSVSQVLEKQDITLDKIRRELEQRKTREALERRIEAVWEMEDKEKRGQILDALHNTLDSFQEENATPSP